MGSSSHYQPILSPLIFPFLRNHPAGFREAIALKSHNIALFPSQKNYSAKAMNYPLICCFVRGFCRIPGT